MCFRFFAHPDVRDCVYIPCLRHVGAPKADQISRAIQEWSRRGLGICAACGRPLVVRRYFLRHMAALGSGKDHEWEVDELLYSEPVAPLRMVVNEAALHLACLRRAIPHAAWLDEAASITERHDEYLSQDPDPA